MTILNGESWIICGGRDFKDQMMFDSAMSEIVQLRGCPSRVIQGGAKGADKMAFYWATQMEIPMTEVYADWEANGKTAGVIRNQKMLDLNPAVIVAFPGGKGTADMVRRGHSKEGVDVIEIKRNCR